MAWRSPRELARWKAKRKFTDKQRAAYWKRKYLALLKSRSR